MKSTTKLQLSILGLSAVIAIAFYAIFALAPSVFWTSDSDWSGGTFSNITNITGDLMLNNTVVNGTQTIYSWYYNNWTYRKAIVINGSTSLQNDYQVMINLTNRTAGSDNFNFARANSQGNDTRFTWLNTSSGLEQNISFWIENWTSSGSLGNATIWVKAPNVSASSVANTTLYMYYGNPSAASTSNGTNTFVASNDFNADYGYTIIDTGSSEAFGSSTGEMRTNANRLDFVAYGAGANSYMYKDYSAGYFSGDFILEYTSHMASVVGNTYEVVSLSDNNGGMAAYNNADGTFRDETYIAPLHVQGGTGNQGSSISKSQGITYYTRLVRSGTTLTMYVFNDSARTQQIAGSPSITATNNQALRYFAIMDRYPGLTGRSITGWMDDVRVRKYTSPEPAALSVGAEQTASSRGTYLSNTTTTASTIASITAIINKTEYNYNGAINLTNLTVDISANGGSSWCGNVANNTAYTSCGGIGSGTQLVYRVNFSTNDTSRTAVLSDITLNYSIVDTILTCDAGGPYLANSSVMITGNVSSGASALASQPVTVQIKNSTVVLNSTVVTSDASGNWVAKLFVNTTNASSVFVNSTYLGISGNCTYPLSVQAQTVTYANATCTTNSTACAFRNYPVSGWVMDSVTGSLIQSGTVTVTIRNTGDSYQSAFSGGYFSVSPQFCLSPGKAYGLTIAVDGNGRRGFIFTNTVGKG